MMSSQAATTARSKSSRMAHGDRRSRFHAAGANRMQQQTGHCQSSRKWGNLPHLPAVNVASFAGSEVQPVLEALPVVAPSPSIKEVGFAAAHAAVLQAKAATQVSTTLLLGGPLDVSHLPEGQAGVKQSHIMVPV